LTPGDARFRVIRELGERTPERGGEPLRVGVDLARDAIALIG